MKTFVMRVVSESGDDWLIPFKASRVPEESDYLQLLQECGRFYQDDLEQCDGPGVEGTSLHVNQIIEITKDEVAIALSKKTNKK